MRQNFHHFRQRNSSELKEHRFLVEIEINGNPFILYIKLYVKYTSGYACDDLCELFERLKF